MATTNHKRGRPALPTKRKRSDLLSFRITPLERQEIEARAERAGLPVRDYVRQVLGWEVRVA